jgi:hypothetical protein
VDKKPKASRAPRKAAKQKLEDKEQSAQFIQTARELEVDESGHSFERVARAIIRPANRGKSQDT